METMERIKAILERAEMPVKGNKNELVVGNRGPLKMYIMGPNGETLGLDVPRAMSLNRVDVGQFKSGAVVRADKDEKTVEPVKVVLKFTRANVIISRVYAQYEISVISRWWDE